MTTEQDIVLIYFEEDPIAFARIEDISPDIKKDWYQVKLLLLQVPLQTVTWILRAPYIDGAPFTMNGKNMRLERVVCPQEANADTDVQTENPKPKAPESGKVISLPRFKK